MNIGVLGTGMVGSAMATRLAELGHEVMMGARDGNNETARAWARANDASHGTFADAARFGDLLFNCTKGVVALDALQLAGAANMEGKILVDISNPLDFSRGMPPTLSVCNTDSLGEQIQRAFPDTRVVKALNTVNCKVQVHPERVPGEHDVFICGNDDEAKSEVKRLLHDGFGWKNIFDLGDISGARGMEMILPIWVRLMGVLGTADFNFHIAMQDSSGK
jgi:predicted dinucleotide-binding enzyme